MSELMIPVSSVIGLVERWDEEARGTDGGYWDAKQDCIADLNKVVQEALPSVAEAAEQFRQQLLASGVVPPSMDVLAELASMQKCLDVLAGLPFSTRYRVLDWVKGRTQSDQAAETLAKHERSEAVGASVADGGIE